MRGKVKVDGSGIAGGSGLGSGCTAGRLLGSGKDGTDTLSLPLGGREPVPVSNPTRYSMSSAFVLGTGVLCWLLGAPLDDIDDKGCFAEAPELSSPGQAGPSVLEL